MVDKPCGNAVSIDYILVRDPWTKLTEDVQPTIQLWRLERKE
jgi:hypothetical protein